MNPSYAARLLAQKRQGFDQLSSSLFPHQTAYGDSDLEQLRDENLKLRQALKDAEFLLKNFSETTNEMYWRTDAEHRFTYMSDMVVVAVDIPMSGQIGKTRAELSDDDLGAPHWVEHLEDLRMHRPFKDFQYTRRHSNGETRFISTSGRPVFDEDGNFEGYVGVAADITDRLEIESKARSAEANLLTAVNVLDAMISIWDEHDRLVLCNEQFLRLNAKVIETCKPGTTFEDHIRALVENGLVDTNGDPEGWVQRRLTNRKAPSGPVEMTRNSGLAILVNEAKLPNGGTIAITADITAQKETERALRQSEQRLRDFGDTAADWFWEMDEQLHFTYVSLVSDEKLDDAEAHQPLAPRDEDVLEGLAELQRGDQRKILEQRSAFADFRIALRGTDGARSHVSVSGKPVFDDRGAFIGYRGVGRDITDLVRTQQALQLERDKAEEANRSKSQFLAHMSHELRTPLNAILGFSDIMREQLLGPIGSDSYIDYANDIHDSGEHLLSLINDLLDIAKIEAGKHKLEEERVDIKTVVDGSLRLFSHRLIRRKISTSIHVSDDARYLLCDRRSLSQMLFNLVSNAEKFGSERGEIKIASSLDDDGGIRLAVRDDGDGFDEKDVQTVLAPFGRIENPMTKAIPGSGLGLPIVNGLISLHQGKLEIDCGNQSGTTVTLVFPPSRTA